MTSPRKPRPARILVRRIPSFFALSGTIGALLLLASQYQRAEAVTWSGATSTDFELGSNWAGVAPINDTTTDIAAFTGTPTANQPVLTVNRSIGGLVFGSASGWNLGGAFTLTLGHTLTVGSTTNVGIDASALTSGSDSILAKLDGSGSAQTWLVGTGGTLNVGSTVKHANLTIGNGSNAGRVVLGDNVTTGADNDSVDVILNAGTLELNKASSMGDHAVSNLRINGGTVKITGSGGRQIYQGGDVDLEAGGTLDLNGHNEIMNNLSSFDTAGGIVTSATAATLTLEEGKGRDFRGVISGSISLVINITNGSNQKLSGANTFTGGTTIKSGLLKINGGDNGNNALGTGTLTIGDVANSGAAATLQYSGGGDVTIGNSIVVVGTGVNKITADDWNPTFSGLITLNNSDLVIGSTNPQGSIVRINGGIGGAGNLTTAAETTHGNTRVEFNTGTVNNTGTITNNGTGSQTTIFNSNIGPNVTGVVQNSETSALSLRGTNSFAGGITIKAGTVNVRQKALGDTAATNVGTITLGDVANTGKSATLNVDEYGIGQDGGGTGANPINVVGTGTRTISVTSWNPTFSGAVTLNGTDLNLVSNNNFDSDLHLSGGITGVGNLTLQVLGTNGGSAVILETTAVNNTGTITNNGSGVGASTISANIGSNVTGLIQNSATSELILSNANTFKGDTTLTSGTLRLTNSAALQNSVLNTNSTAGAVAFGASTTSGLTAVTLGGLAGNGNVNLNNTLTSAGTVDLTIGNSNTAGTNTTLNPVYSGILSNSVGNAAVTKVGTNTQTFAGANTYTGPTAVFGGTLLVTGSISGSAVTVFDGATLGGTGTTGSVTVLGGGTVAPGVNVGKLSTGDYGVFDSTARLAIQLGKTTVGGQPVAGFDYDQLSVTGAVSLDGDLALTLNLGIQANDLFFIIANDGLDEIAGAGLFATINGASYNPNSFVVGGQQFKISFSADSTGGTFTGGNDVAIMAVPEPGSMGTLLGGIGMLLGWQRRRAARRG